MAVLSNRFILVLFLSNTIWATQEVTHTLTVAASDLGGLSKALQQSRDLLRQGEGVMLVLGAGSYSEELDLSNWKKPAKTPFIIRAEKSGSVTWYGVAIRIEEWLRGDDGFWEKKKIDLPEDSRLMVGKTPLKRGANLLGKLGYGEYVYDPDTKKLQIRLERVVKQQPDIWLLAPPTGKPLILANDFSYLALRGISFVGNRSFPAAVCIKKSQGLEITQCSFLYSQGSGLLLEEVHNVSLSSLKASNNVLEGFSMHNTRRVQATSLTAENNDNVGISINRGGTLSFIFSRIVDNGGIGLLIKSPVGSLSIQNPFVARNGGDGICLEGSTSPFSLDGGEIAMNRGAGIRLKTPNSIIKYSILVGNGRPGLGQEPLGQIVLEKSPESANAHCWQDNIIMGLEPGVPLVDLPLSNAILGSLDNNQNLYYQKSLEAPFRILHQGLSWAEYRNLTSTDLKSDFGDPQFYNLENYDYQLLPNSPFLNKENWDVFVPKPDRDTVFVTVKDRIFDHFSPHPVYQEEVKPIWIPWALTPSLLPKQDDLYKYLLPPGVSKNEKQLQYRQIPFLPAPIILPNSTARKKFLEKNYFTAWKTEESGRVGVLSLTTNKKTAYFKDLFLLTSLIGQGTFPEKAKITLLYDDETTFEQTLKTPGTTIPWEKKEFYDYLNHCHWQESVSNAFHFSGRFTLPIAFRDTVNQSINYCYLVRIVNPHPKKRVKAVVLRSNLLDNSIAVIHAVTLRK